MTETQLAFESAIRRGGDATAAQGLSLVRAALRVTMTAAIGSSFVPSKAFSTSDNFRGVPVQARQFCSPPWTWDMVRTFDYGQAGSSVERARISH